SHPLQRLRAQRDEMPRVNERHVDFHRVETESICPLGRHPYAIDQCLAGFDKMMIINQKLTMEEGTLRCPLIENEPLDAPISHERFQRKQNLTHSIATHPGKSATARRNDSRKTVTSNRSSRAKGSAGGKAQRTRMPSWRRLPEDPWHRSGRRP